MFPIPKLAEKSWPQLAVLNLFCCQVCSRFEKQIENKSIRFTVSEHCNFEASWKEGYGDLRGGGEEHVISSIIQLKKTLCLVVPHALETAVPGLDNVLRRLFRWMRRRTGTSTGRQVSSESRDLGHAIDIHRPNCLNSEAKTYCPWSQWVCCLIYQKHIGKCAASSSVVSSCFISFIFCWISKDWSKCTANWWSLLLHGGASRGKLSGKSLNFCITQLCIRWHLERPCTLNQLRSSRQPSSKMWQSELIEISKQS